jgi:predicted helicase
MAPYAIGHMKIGFLLEALGIPLQNGERFRFYLTNALEMEDLQQIDIPGLSSLSEESHQAARVKKDEPILVIIGNPPYSGMSANQNRWTEELLKTDIDGAQSYYTVDGKPLGEKNPKWLQDDYVKFLRFAQWKIHKTGRGIVAMITNHWLAKCARNRHRRKMFCGSTCAGNTWAPDFAASTPLTVSPWIFMPTSRV